MCSGHLPAFIDPIVPAARAAKTSSDEAWLAATIGAEYHLTSGAVTLIR